jgi:hypothetical protein
LISYFIFFKFPKFEKNIILFTRQLNVIIFITIINLNTTTIGIVVFLKRPMSSSGRTRGSLGADGTAAAAPRARARVSVATDSAMSFLLALWQGLSQGLGVRSTLSKNVESKFGGDWSFRV